MKKRLILSFSIIGGIIVLFIILLFTLFGVKNVKLDLRTNNSIFSSPETQEKVIESGNFAFNMPIFFQNKKVYIENLEKNNPYLKVINIQSVFPNTLVVKCVDREEAFAVKVSDNNYFILDEDLKILNQTTSFSSNQTNAILLDGDFAVLNPDADKGDFLQLNVGQELLQDFVPAMKLNNRNIAEQKALFQSVSLKFRIDPLSAKNRAYLELYDYTGLKMCVFEAEDSLVEKLNCLLAVQSVFDPANVNDYELRVLENSNGEIFCHQTQKV